MKHNTQKFWLQLVFLLTLVMTTRHTTLLADINLPKYPQATQQSCAAPPEDMRRHHMNYLMHTRVATMHKGIRTKQHSLKSCVDCHASKDKDGAWISINAKGQFCNSCHTYVSVNIDCFECHATKPKSTSQPTQKQTTPHVSGSAPTLDLQMAAQVTQQSTNQPSINTITQTLATHSFSTAAKTGLTTGE